MEIFFLVLLLIFIGSLTAFLSSVLISISQEFLKEKSEKKAGNAQRLLYLKMIHEDTPSPFFFIEMFFYTVSAVLIGYTVPVVFEGYSHNWQFVIYSLIIFFATAIMLRIVFSALGRKHARNIALALTSVLNLFSVISRPFNSVYIILDKKIGGKVSDDLAFEELSAYVESAREDGALDYGEYRIFKNLLHFSDVHVTDVMTPRTVLFSCMADSKVHEVVNLPELRMYSRFPIWEGESLDDGAIGYVLTRDVLHAALTGKSNKKLRDFAQEVYFIPENASLDKALDTFLQRRQHMFLVVDEYGGVEGILTMEDVLETIIGAEIVDEADKFVDMRALAKQRRDQRIASMTSPEN